MNKHQIKSAQTKQNLCTAYLALLSEKEIDQITVQDIVSRAKYNRGTFYNHFPSTYVVLRQIKSDFINRTKQQVQQALANQPSFDLKTIIKSTLQIFINNEEFIVPLITKDPTFPDDVKKAIRPIIKDYLSPELKNTQADYLIEYHFSSLIGLFQYWAERKKDLPLEDLFKLIEQTVTQGVFTVLIKQ